MVRQGFGSGRVSVPSFGAEFRCRVSVPSFGARFRCRVSVPSFDEDYITHARQITNIGITCWLRNITVHRNMKY